MVNLEIFQRHVIKRESHFSEFLTIVKRTIVAKKSTNFNFHMILNYAKDLSKELKDSILESTKILVENDIPLHLSPALGAGNAFLQALEKSLSIVKNGSSVSILLDGDQYDISSKEMLDRLQLLANKVIQKNALLGLGRRDFIVLSENFDLQRLREIDEMYHSLFIKNNLELNDNEEIEKILIPRAYKKFGDPIPACYCFNLFHPNFFDFISQVQKDFNRANLNKYAGDPYIVMCASKYGKIVSTKVSCIRNPPSVFNNDDFKKKTQEIAKTAIGQEYIYCLESERNSKILEEFYEKESIDEFKRLSLQ